MKAGLGPPPAHLLTPQTAIFNTTRLLDHDLCPRLYWNRWEQDGGGLLTGDGLRPSLPLALGGAMHKALERGTAPRPFYPDDLAEQGSETVEKWEKAHDWAARTWGAYAGYWEDKTPAWGRTLMQEQPAWLWLDSLLVFEALLPPKHANPVRLPSDWPLGPVLFLLTPDAIVEAADGTAAILERKTVSPRFADAIMEDRRRHWQQALQVEWLARFAGELEEGLGAAENSASSGCVTLPPSDTLLLDVLVKEPWPAQPVNTTKDGRITPAYAEKLRKWEEKKATWQDRVFHRRELTYPPRKRQELLAEMLWQVLLVEQERAGQRPVFGTLGPRCSAWSRTCAWKPWCLTGSTPSAEEGLASRLADGEGPDYVDAARRAAQTEEAPT